MYEAAANQRHTARDGCADSQAPVSILIKAENLAGEGHSQSHQQKEDAENPRKLAWKFVGAEQKDLRHMNEHHGRP